MKGAGFEPALWDSHSHNHIEAKPCTPVLLHVLQFGMNWQCAFARILAADTGNRRPRRATDKPAGCLRATLRPAVRRRAGKRRRRRATRRCGCRLRMYSRPPRPASPNRISAPRANPLSRKPFIHCATGGYCGTVQAGQTSEIASIRGHPLDSCVWVYKSLPKNLKE